MAIAFVVLVVWAASAAGGAPADEGVSAGNVDYQRTVVEGGDGPDVAVVPVEGVIVNGSGSPADGTVGGDALIELLDELADDDDVEGIILEMNTPGGAVLASAEVADRIKKLREDDDKKVVAWMRDTSASGGYYIAANADTIVAHPSTITGSIGVILSYLNLQGLADKVGVKPVVVKSGKLKDIGSPFKPLTDEEQKVLQSIITEAYGDFVEVVAEGRDMDEEKVRVLADGRIYTGRQAEANGLVDELGSQDTAIKEMEDLLDEDDINAVRYDAVVSIFDAFGFAAQGNTKLLDEVARGLTSGIAQPGGTPSSRGAAGHPGALPQIEYRAVL